MKKRFISLLLTVALLMTCVTPTMAVSTPSVSVDEHAYSVVQGYLGCFDDALGAAKISQRYVRKTAFTVRYLLSREWLAAWVRVLYAYAALSRTVRSSILTFARTVLYSTARR